MAIRRILNLVNEQAQAVRRWYHTTMVTPHGTEAGKLLTQVVRFISTGVLDEVFATAGAVGENGHREPVTAAQFEVLRYIDRHERPTIKEVATALKMSSAAATKAVNGLSDERAVPLVRRTRGSDRRTVRLTTTPAGAELVRQVREAYTERLDGVLARMASADQAALVQGLKALLRTALSREFDCDAACLRCGIDHVDDCVVHLAGQVLKEPVPPKC